MIKKTIKFTDFNGTEVEEDYYFHLSTPEQTRIYAKLGSQNVKEAIEAMVKRNNFSEMLAFFEDIVLTAYGQKTLDGRSFTKNPEETKLFEYSPAYAELFEELMTDADKLVKFAEGVNAVSKSNAQISKFQPKSE